MHEHHSDATAMLLGKLHSIHTFDEHTVIRKSTVSVKVANVRTIVVLVALTILALKSGIIFNHNSDGQDNEKDDTLPMTLLLLWRHNANTLLWRPTLARIEKEERDAHDSKSKHITMKRRPCQYNGRRPRRQYAIEHCLYTGICSKCFAIT